MAEESASTTRLFVLHGGHEIGPLQFREVMDRLRTGALALDDPCRLEGTQDRAPLRVVLPKVGPPLPIRRAPPSMSRSDSFANLPPPERIIPSAESPIGTGFQRASKQDAVPVAPDKSSIELHRKVVIKATPSPAASSTALEKTETMTSTRPASPASQKTEAIDLSKSPPTAPPKTNLWMWRWLMWSCLVAAGLLALLLVMMLQRRSAPSPQPNAPTTPVPTVTAAPTVASPPSSRPDQRDYALSRFIQAKQAFQQHDLAVARALIDQADAADPNQPAILNLRGEILTEQKEYELAEAAFRKAIEIDPNFYDAKNNLANLLSKKQAAEASPTAIPTVTPQRTPAESPSVVERMPGEQFPETRSRLMAGSDVENWTPEQLQYAINEMYARHGADFLDQEIKRQFTSFEWYHPRSGQTYEETEKLFSTIELYNLNLLASYRDAREAGVPPRSPSGGSSPPSDSTQHQTAGRPKIVYAPHPTYPPNADKMHVTGAGRFKITFDERGNTKSVEIVQSTGNRTLDSNTIKTLKLWRAAPGSPFYVVVPIDYRQKRQSSPKPRTNTSQHYQSPDHQPQPPPRNDAPQSTLISPYIPR
jgi:TonB family protein